MSQPIENQLKWLGQKNSYHKELVSNDATVLDRILRVKSKGHCYGHDIWLCYEVSWLASSGKPTYKIGELIVPLDSKYIIESKSLKLYFNQFNHVNFSSEAVFISQVTQEISNTLESVVQFRLYNPLRLSHTALKGICIDEESPEEKNIVMDQNEIVDHETLYTHLFRSNCPVTNQPDWASIIITYSGPKMNRGAVLEYLLNYREKQAFHEQCISEIYSDLLQQCHCLELIVYGAFTRRGGIAIHPIRATNEIRLAQPYHFLKT